MLKILEVQKKILGMKIEHDKDARKILGTQKGYIKMC